MCFTKISHVNVREKSDIKRILLLMCSCIRVNCSGPPQCDIQTVQRVGKKLYKHLMLSRVEIIWISNHCEKRYRISITIYLILYYLLFITKNNFYQKSLFQAQSNFRVRHLLCFEGSKFSELSNICCNRRFMQSDELHFFQL